MSVERRWRSVPALASLLVALVLVACDGGIFGTGDGSEPSVSTSDGDMTPPVFGGEESDGDDEDFGEGSPGDTDGVSGADPGEDDGGDGEGELVPSAAFSNTLDVDAGSAPRVRLVNASALSVELVDEGGTSLAGPSVRPGTSGALVELPPTIDELRLRRADENGEAALLYRLVPTALSMSSVTTLIVRDAETTGGPGRGVDVIPLETRLAPSDPAQALVRIVQGGLRDDPDEEAVTRRYRLVPAGASPGGVEVAFEGITFGADPATRYLDVPAGDYRLEDSMPNGEGTVLSPRPVSIEPGSVRTFVIIGVESVIDVIDSGSAKR